MTKAARSRSAGFTLVELLVVIGMGALTLTVVILARPQSTALRLQSEARSLLRDLSLARESAVLTNTEIAVLVDPVRHEVRRGQAVHRIPRDMKVTMTGADAERVGDNGGLRFYPDGQSSGGAVVLAMQDRQVHISINWLTGLSRVTQ